MYIWPSGLLWDTLWNVVQCKEKEWFGRCLLVITEHWHVIIIRTWQYENVDLIRWHLVEKHHTITIINPTCYILSTAIHVAQVCVKWRIFFRGFDLLVLSRWKRNHDTKFLLQSQIIYWTSNIHEKFNFLFGYFLILEIFFHLHSLVYFFTQSINLGSMEEKNRDKRYIKKGEMWRK